MSQAFSQWLRRRIEETGLSERQVAHGARLGARTVNSILHHPEFDPRPETCQKLAAFFQVPVDYLMRLAGHLPPRRPPDVQPGEEELLADYRLLNPQRRRAVREMVRGLRQVEEHEARRAGAREEGTPSEQDRLPLDT